MATSPPADDARSADREGGTLARARKAVLSDDRLAKQAAAGDIGALEAIFSRYRDDLYRFSVGILREPQDAQDAVQNTMIKAMRALPGERRAMRLKPWLYRIAHNEAVELRRRERPVEELPATVDDVGALTDERAEENGRLRTLLADIADLPERQRASLVLREVNGLGFGEIGAALGTSPGAVRQALYEARRGLAEMDNGRDMQCDAATRLVSDADGRPRDRGVRAHLRDCSPCRRFQAEIRERTRTFAAISPMPALAVAGALKVALVGAGTGAGGTGAAAVAGGSGVGGVAAGSIGASVLLKPAVGLLAVLAIGTAAVDHGRIFRADRHGSKAVAVMRSAPPPAEHADKSLPEESRAVARRAQHRSAAAATGDRIHSSSAPAPAPPATAVPVEEEPVASIVAPRPRGDAEPPGEDEVAALTATSSPTLEGTSHHEALVPGTTAPLIDLESEGGPGASVGDVPPGQAKEETVPPGQAKKEVETTAAPETSAAPATTTESSPRASTPTETAAPMPPGQAKKETVPQGQAKKELETTAAPATMTEASAPAATATEAPAHVPPGQAKKEVETMDQASEPSQGSNLPVEATEAPELPPGQVKKEEAATE